MKKFSVLFLFLFANITLIYCQDFGGFANGIDWKQIDTRSVRVIFPTGMETQANRVANTISYIDQNNRTTIGDRFKKIDLILNNQGVIPNGYVALLPYRSEFYTTPFQQSDALGSLPWLDLLAIHEYRHALQYSNFLRGITKLGYLFSGESFWSLALLFSTPDWYFEGDAVCTETALSVQGRGRIPVFYQGYKSTLNSRKPYTYEKAKNGSFKHDVPDHYSLGYLLTSYGREEYNDSLWLNVMDRTARYKGIIYPFSKALKHYTGLSSRQFYHEALNSYQDKWDEELLKISDDYSQELSQPGRTITNYTYTVSDPNSNKWLCVKSSYQKTAAIYEVKADGSEVKITDIGINLDPYFSVGTKYLCWAEITGDARFTSKSYSDIVAYDRSTKKKKIITKGQRYFSPSISPDESKILIVQANLMEEINLLVLNSSTGEILKKIPNPDKLYYTYPVWSSNGKDFLSSVRYPNGHMGIVEIDGETGDSKVIIAPSNNIIGNISLANNKVFFSASFGGRDNIFVLS